MVSRSTGACGARMRMHVHFRACVCVRQLELDCRAIILPFCDSSVRKKDWRCRKRGTHATRARQGDFAVETRPQQWQSFERIHTHTALQYW